MPARVGIVIVLKNLTHSDAHKNRVTKFFSTVLPSPAYYRRGIFRMLEVC